MLTLPAGGSPAPDWTVGRRMPQTTDDLEQHGQRHREDLAAHTEGDASRADLRRPFQGAALRAARGAVPDAAASARAGRAASGRSPRGARLRHQPQPAQRL